MLKKFYPYEYVESVYTIDYQELYNKGFKGLIFDIDNTLVPHGEDATKQAEELFRVIHAIWFKTILLSNNNEERVKRFIKNIDTLYVCNAEKPRPDNYLKAIQMLGLDKDEVIFIGDQVFTDIYGANRCGIKNILVKYIGYYEKNKKGIRRTIEKIILKLYSISKSSKNKIGNIEKGGKINNVWKE